MCDKNDKHCDKHHNKHDKKHHCMCNKILYSIGVWADNRVIEIKFIPQFGNSISWTTAANTLSPSNPTNINHWNMQSPITLTQFPIFPLKLRCGDRIVFIFNNDINTPNAFACAANIDGNIYRTVNSTISSYSNKITLHPLTGYTIVDPSYNPITDLPTRNIIDTINYISVNPKSNNYILVWTL